MECWTLLRRAGGREVKETFVTAPTPGTRPTFEEFVFNCVTFPAYRFTSTDEDELLYLKTMQEIIGAAYELKSRQP